MATEKVVRCDSCGKTKMFGEKHEGGPWLFVQTAVTDAEEYAMMAQKLEGVTDPKTVMDFGDFCTLTCLANWASAQAGLRALDEEVENGQGQVI